MAKKKESAQEPRDNVLDVIKLLARERGIDEEELIKAVEDGMVTAYKREFSSAGIIETVEAEIDRETGEIYVYQLKEVVDEVEDPVNEVSIEEAKAADPDVELGDFLEYGLDADKLGRLAATAAKSAISQKVRSAEYKRINDEFSGKIGELASGIIVRKDARNVYVDIDHAEAVLPRNGQIRGESYEVNRTMKFLVLRVEEHNDRPSITVSRTAPELVKKLFELEIPEVKSGEVIIQGVTREPGSRSKVAVYSRDENIDAKGSCVGPRGQRVQTIMNELGGEKIDIIDWNEDPALFISEALQPAKAIRVDTEVTTKEDGHVERYAKVIVPDQQFNLAIGRAGQNVRLAAHLTGYKIDIKRESDDATEATQSVIDKFTVAEEESTDGEQTEE
ncbi:MAG: transcription termination/antitermination protein NusA [Clostridiales bacterium]|nr:transcription termination/antitermination protein NusA [Clostridiales bacterium]